ncbi:uncharacterized protein LOC143573796 [Bidens hawaiensis]|uniref:uncharacterized protein LOC143573796 n=1 Tax=Bidens hawaiensis TaxID=980011 RepID=UPI0040492612
MMQQILNRDQVTQKNLADHDMLLKNQQSAMLNMQRTIGDIARQLKERPPGQFSGSTQQNPAAQMKAITIRSGRILGPEVRRNEVEVEVEDEEVMDEEVMDEEIEMEVPGKVQNTAPVAPPVVKKSVKLKINLPFIAALQHMPKYAKFLKDLLKRKDRLGEVSSIPLMGDCSAVLLNRVPEKLSDPGVLTIACLYGSDVMTHAFGDLGESINLMPYSLYKKLELGELTPTHMSLSLADRSIKYPRVIIENFLVKVDKFVFPVDFVVSIVVSIIFVVRISWEVMGCCESEAGSEEKPALLELKVLRSHLEYAYLDEGSNLPIIVSSKLMEEQMMKLIEVLKRHKGGDYMETFRYSSKSLNDAQENHTTTEKELLDVVFAFDKFRSYPMLPKTTVFTDNAALRFLFQKKDAKPHLIRWILLLYEFDIEIKDKKGAENVAANHLSRLEDPRREELFDEEIGDTFPHESIDFVDMTMQQKRKIFKDVNRYVWDDPLLFKISGDRILRRCVTKEEGWDILNHVHEGLTGGHHGAHATAQKALKTVNVDLTAAARKRYFQIHELEELRDAAYSRSLNIKEKTKALHDRRLKGGKEFKKGDKVLLFNSRLKLFAGKLRSKFTGPCLVKEVFPYGVVKLENPDNGTSWKVNGHRLKHYLGGPEESIDMEETLLDPSH